MTKMEARRIETPVLGLKRTGLDYWWCALDVYGDPDPLRPWICGTELRWYWGVPKGRRIVLVATDRPVRGAQRVNMSSSDRAGLLPDEKGRLSCPCAVGPLLTHLRHIRDMFGSLQFWGWVEIVGDD